LDKEIRTDYHHELHSDSCFSGKSVAEGCEDQISLRTRPSYSEQVTVVTTKKSGVSETGENLYLAQAKFDF